MHTLQFDLMHKYLDERGISVEVILGYSGVETKTLAKVDTGAEMCIFKREHAEGLGLDVERGFRQAIATATGSFVAWGHEVTLSCLGFRFDAMVYFADQPNHPRNVLGRRGWLEQVRLGIIDYDRTLYLSKYGA